MYKEDFEKIYETYKSNIENLTNKNMELQEENEKINKIANEFQNRIGKALYYIEHTTFYCARSHGKTMFNEYLKGIRNVLKGEKEIEDRKIEKIKISSRFTRNQKVIIHKINEIIDRLNGEDNE